MRRVFVCWMLALCLVSGVAFAQGKYALVIGNASYVGADRLSTPLNDASLLAARLKQLGFQVSRYDNLDRRAMFAGVADFASRARSADVIVFYYAGHGFDVGGQNYLIPVNLSQPIDRMDAAALQRDGMSLAVIRGALARAGARAQVIFIDACRTSPGRGVKKHSMAFAQAANGVVLAWSTAPGSAAIDSMQALGKPIDHSPFAYYLAANLAQPQLGIIQVLQRTQQEVSVATGNVQRPWYSSGLVGTLRLAAINAGPTSTSALANPVPSNAQRRGADTQPTQAATALWASEWQAIARAQGLLDAPRLQSLREQAAHGDHRPQMILGVAYEQGNWVRPDPALAMGYYREAAKGGYVPGETALGESYYEGKLVARNLAKADRWLQAASNAGDRRAWLDFWQLRTERDSRENPQAVPADEAQLSQRMADYFMKLAPASTSSTGGP